MAQIRVPASIVLALALLALSLLSTDGVSAADSKATVDRSGAVGLDTSLELDGSGNPVVSYYDASNGDLKVVHCSKPSCRGPKTITSPDTAGFVGRFTSLELDGSGNPVVSYYDFTGGNLKVMHCNDPNCSGGGESITSPDTAGDVGLYTSLELDGSGNPVVSYYRSDTGDLRLLGCDDSNCS